MFPRWDAARWRPLQASPESRRSAVASASLSRGLGGGGEVGGTGGTRGGCLRTADKCQHAQQWERVCTGPPAGSVIEVQTDELLLPTGVLSTSCSLVQGGRATRWGGSRFSAGGSDGSVVTDDAPDRLELVDEPPHASRTCSSLFCGGFYSAAGDVDPKPSAFLT